MKLNVLLAKTEALASPYKAMIKDYIKFFKSSGSAFLGVKKTYVPRPDTVDVPSMSGITRIQTTVEEKLEWLEENAKPYINALFSQERTNAQGHTVPLSIGGKTIANLTSLELLRLKSLLESQELKDMYATLPVRSDAQNWLPSTSEDYSGRKVYESTLLSGINKTTDKESYILEDPNIGKNPNYNPAPQMGVKTTTKELGDYTQQFFTGEISQRERAEILQRRQTLYTAVITALKEANEVEAVPSELTSEKLFGYIHHGTI